MTFVFLTLYLFSVFAAFGAATYAAWSDFKGLRIPNSVPLIALISFAIAYLSAWAAGATELVFGPLGSHLGAALILFLMTFLLFVFKAFGAGDAKMASAYGLWCTWALFPGFLMVMTLSGAILALFALVLRKVPLSEKWQIYWLAHIKAGKNAVPYGIAIWIAVIYVILAGNYLAMDTLRAF
ncbi:MAG: prepilin peptidase [Pseudobdellovibrionaceae bacterium]